MGSKCLTFALKDGNAVWSSGEKADYVAAVRSHKSTVHFDLLEPLHRAAWTSQSAQLNGRYSPEKRQNVVELSSTA